MTTLEKVRTENAHLFAEDEASEDERPINKASEDNANPDYNFNIEDDLGEDKLDEVEAVQQMTKAEISRIENELLFSV